MRKRVFNWQGQGFVHLCMEGMPGKPLDQQAKSLFDRARDELKGFSLTMDKNVVRTRLFCRTREAREVATEARGRILSGQSRSASSSFISPAHLESGGDIALELYAMSPPGQGPGRKVVEHEPKKAFIRHLSWGPMVFLAGMTSEKATLKEQYEDILPLAGKILKETGCEWANIAKVSFFLHHEQDPDALLSGVAATAPVPLGDAEVEFVEGYSRPGTLVEIEITARR
jgi:enamine deaminase RidA (YjgF/YER057c/UK114 family)